MHQELQEKTYTQAAKGAEGVDALISRTEDLSKAMAQSLQLSVGGPAAWAVADRLGFVRVCGCDSGLLKGFCSLSFTGISSLSTRVILASCAICACREKDASKHASPGCPST
jgi:hypothetical protein